MHYKPLASLEKGDEIYVVEFSRVGITMPKSFIWHSEGTLIMLHTSGQTSDGYRLKLKGQESFVSYFSVHTKRVVFSTKQEAAWYLLDMVEGLTAQLR
jgi:hypothetical protein